MYIIVHTMYGAFDWHVLSQDGSGDQATTAYILCFLPKSQPYKQATFAFLPVAYTVV